MAHRSYQAFLAESDLVATGNRSSAAKKDCPKIGEAEVTDEIETETGAEPVRRMSRRGVLLGSTGVGVVAAMAQQATGMPAAAQEAPPAAASDGARPNILFS